MLTWLTRLCAPIVFLYDNLITYRALILKQLAITPQVVYLIKMLNDKYDTRARRITIVDAPKYDPLYLFKKDENKPMLLKKKGEGGEAGRIFLVKKGETVGHGYDFIVRIPTDVNADANELKALIDNYKLAGKKYNIQ